MRTTYRCHLCGNTITLHINVTRPPTCCNPKKHSGKRVDMNIHATTTDSNKKLR